MKTCPKSTSKLHTSRSVTAASGDSWCSLKALAARRQIACSNTKSPCALSGRLLARKECAKPANNLGLISGSNWPYKSTALKMNFWDQTTQTTFLDL